MVQRGRGPFLPQDIHSMWPEGQGARCVQDGVAGVGQGSSLTTPGPAGNSPLGLRAKGSQQRT